MKRYTNHHLPPKFAPHFTYAYPEIKTWIKQYADTMHKPAKPEKETLITNQWFLYGVDLFNGEYYWEAHEIFETLWHLVEKNGEVHLFLKGLIQCGISILKKQQNNIKSTRTLHSRGFSYLDENMCSLVGIDLERFKKDHESYISDKSEKPPQIILQGL